MNKSVYHIPTIADFHSLVGLDPPAHPHVTYVPFSEKFLAADFQGIRMSSSCYTIMLKGHKGGLPYGRNRYDYEAGTLIFIAPDQVMMSPEDEEHEAGWMLSFFPDLIRKYELGRTIDRYSFFSYDVTEALHMSDQERELVSDCATKVQLELEGELDAHSQDVIVSNIQLILNYSQRFFERQFDSRTPHHQDLLTQFEGLLKSHFDTARLREHGQPTIQSLAEEVHLSPNYLSDLLRKETGKNAKEHLNDFVIDRAKGLLLGSDRNVSEIAYDLGFNYPHYFSRMFKARTGFTPKDFRHQS